MNQLTREELFQFCESVKADYESLLKQIVEIPTISADASYQHEIANGAQWAARQIEKAGGVATIYEQQGLPLVHGVFFKDGRFPTLTLYNHLDVQPASKQEEPWETDPFMFVKKENKYYGRGTTDDKGPALTAFYAIIAAQHYKIPLNIQILWEFEEEIGSTHFSETLASIPDLLPCVRVIVSDTIWISPSQPACTAGLRGFQGFRFHLKTGTGDRHSGETGGAATFEIHGVTGGYTGPGIKSIVPAEAEVKASCRLVPDQSPDRIFELITNFVKEKNRDVLVHREQGIRPFKARADAMMREAMEFAFGKAPVFIREGGTIGAVLVLEELLKCPVVFLNLSLPEHGYHAPNENFDWLQASRGITAFVKYFEKISTLKEGRK